jgi:eukaryotic-like serine/threonine-protein kinase
MNADRWAQIDRLLDEALACAAGERATFLDAACAGDEELRHEVESLLAAHDRAEKRFLQAPALEVAAQKLAKQSNRSLAGKTIGQFNVLAPLGAGGMGEVYLARDTRLNRKVALKMLPPQFTQDAVRVKRFEREARAASALNHPNIITIYDIGESGNEHYIATEYVDGKTLREKLNRGPLPQKDALEIAYQITDALAAAHEAGIIHRDIKPENVMVRRDGYVKVLDFGLAKLLEKAEGGRMKDEKTAGPHPSSFRLQPLTALGAVLGTLRYMSPEQALGQEASRRSDIFSLGIVLYELVTGAPPFKGATTADLLDAIVHHNPPLLRQIRPDLHPELERIVNRALEKDPDLRYQTASDLRSELKRLRRELDSSLTQSLNSSGSSAPLVQPRDRSAKRLLPVMAGVLAVALFGFFVATRFLAARETEPSPWPNAFTTRITDMPGEEYNPSLAPNGKSVYYEHFVNGQWDIFWLRVGGSNATNLTPNTDQFNDREPACSPNGSSLVFRSERNGGGLFMMGASGESVRKISGFGHNPAWSPDGKEIVCGTDAILDPKRRIAESKLWIINVATNEARQLVTQGDAAQPRWSPHGKRIAFYYRSGKADSDIWTVPAQGGAPTPLLSSASFDWNPVWSADGRYLYFASDRTNSAGLWRVRVDEARGEMLGQPEPITGPTAEVLQMDLARDGRSIVYTTRIQHANIQAINFDPLKKKTVGEPDWITRGSRTSGSPNVSPNGKLVAVHSLGSAQEDIWLAPSDGNETQLNLTNDHWIDRSPRWSPDGKRLAFYSNRTGRAQIWLINADGSGLQQLTYSEQGASTPCWSPNGKRLSYNISNNRGGAQIIEVERAWAQQQPVVLPRIGAGAERWFNAYTWSPDGKRLAGTVAEKRGEEVRVLPGIMLYSLETQRYETITEVGARPEWLDDNRHLTVIHKDGIWLLDSETRALSQLVNRPPISISSHGFAPDKRRIYYTATEHQADLFLLSLDK